MTDVEQERMLGRLEAKTESMALAIGRLEAKVDALTAAEQKRQGGMQVVAALGSIFGAIFGLIGGALMKWLTSQSSGAP